MKLVNKINGGTVEVSDDYAKRLKETGEWEEPKKPARSTRTKSPKEE